MPGVILVIEAEPGALDLLERGLQDHGFEIRPALDGISGAEIAINENIDLVLLDMMLTGGRGLPVLAAVREAKPALPVILMSARREVEDLVMGLDAGAVDYLTKPFSVSELAARIRAHLRAAAYVSRAKLRAGKIEIDLLTREVRRAAELVRFSNTEFELLVYLLRNRGRVLSREQILSSVWGFEPGLGSNLVDVYIGYVRRKLRHGRWNAPIVTVRSDGYRFDTND